MIQKFISNSKKGMATLEMLIAMALLVIVISAVLPMVSGGQSMSVGSETNQEALYKAQALLEDARANAKLDFNLVNPVSATPDSIYQKSLSVQQVDYYTKKVTGTAQWQGANGQNLSVNLSTLVTNPDGYTNNSICNSVLSNANGWKNPIHYDKSTTNLVNEATGNSSSGLAIGGLKVYNQKLYLAAMGTANDDANFYVSDLPTNPAQWTSTYNGYKGSLGTNLNVSGNGNKGGLAALAVAPKGNNIYAYVANTININTQGQLQIIDVTNPTPTPSWNPTITRFKIPNVSNTKLGNSIFYNDGYIYLGLTGNASNGTEFNIIDVSNPQSPQRIGGYSTGGHTVNSIFIKDKYAYIGTPDNENMTILDISNPASPIRLNGYSPISTPESDGVGSNHGKSIYVVGNRLYLGRTYGSTEFYIINTSNPANISVEGSKDIGTSNKFSVNGLAVRDYLAFLFTKSQFQVWDTQNIANIKPWTTSGTISEFSDSNHNLNSYGGDGTTAFSCVGDYFYVATNPSNNKDAISIITAGP